MIDFGGLKFLGFFRTNLKLGTHPVLPGQHFLLHGVSRPNSQTFLLMSWDLFLFVAIWGSENMFRYKASTLTRHRSFSRAIRYAIFVEYFIWAYLMIFRSQREFRVTFTARSIKSVFACAILTTVRYIVQCHSITPKHINRIGIQIMLISISLLVIYSTNLHQEKGYLLDFFLLCNDRLINTSLLKLLLKEIKE